MTEPDTYFPALKIVLRRDERGFYAMSTACTYDLAALEKREGKSGGYEWRSPYTTSTYSSEGAVLSGPAVEPLPYYELRLEAGAYGGEPDTLFVKVGTERSRDWRLDVGRGAK